jgi:hypothetical protein
MAPFGKKLSKNISTLGRKVQEGTSMIGRKVTTLERQAKRGIAKGVELGQGAVRDVERGIVQASGKIGSVKQGLLKGANVIDALQTTGLASMVPGLGVGLAGASGALRAGAGGLKQLQDVGRDTRMATGKAKNQLASVGQRASSQVSGVAGRARGGLEKASERAKELEQRAQQDIETVRGAFAN